MFQRQVSLLPFFILFSHVYPITRITIKKQNICFIKSQVLSESSVSTNKLSGVFLSSIYTCIYIFYMNGLMYKNWNIYIVTMLYINRQTDRRNIIILMNLAAISAISIKIHNVDNCYNSLIEAILTHTHNYFNEEYHAKLQNEVSDDNLW